MENSNREFFNCSCFTEGLILEHFDEEFSDSSEREIYIATWNYGKQSGEMSWKNRFRWCWNILKTGLPWTDMCILHRDEARRLGLSLLRRVADDAKGKK